MSCTRFGILGSKCMACDTIQPPHADEALMTSFLTRRLGHHRRDGSSAVGITTGRSSRIIDASGTPFTKCRREDNDRGESRQGETFRSPADRDGSIDPKSPPLGMID